jgi:hypothetical protein
MSTKKESKELNPEQLKQVSAGHDSGEYAPKRKDEELNDELQGVVGGHDSGEYAPRNDGGELYDKTKPLFLKEKNTQ